MDVQFAGYSIGELPASKEYQVLGIDVDESKLELYQTGGHGVRLSSAYSNPVDTDGGLHPQNIFRLVTRAQSQNERQQADMIVNADNLSASSNRNASNGLFFFNRYQDANNLYYTGLRVDGYAVIKKKINGAYFTMAYRKVLPGSYNRDTAPDLLPRGTWIGLRSEVVTQADGSVLVSVYTDVGHTGSWTLVAQARDDGSSFGGAVIAAGGHAGIRTDFMDVQFQQYSLSEL